MGQVLFSDTIPLTKSVNHVLITAKHVTLQARLVMHQGVTLISGETALIFYASHALKAVTAPAPTQSAVLQQTKAGFLCQAQLDPLNVKLAARSAPLRAAAPLASQLTTKMAQALAQSARPAVSALTTPTI